MPTERIKGCNCTYEKRIAKLGLLTLDFRPTTAREFPTPPQGGGVNIPNFRTTHPQLHIFITPLISHRGVLNIIFTFVKYEQYL